MQTTDEKLFSHEFQSCMHPKIPVVQLPKGAVVHAFSTGGQCTYRVVKAIGIYYRIFTISNETSGIMPESCRNPKLCLDHV